MMRKTLFWLGVLFAFILAVSSDGSAAEVRGVTDTEVVVGWTTPLSGPAALWGVTGLGGKAWADHINAQGGVHGRKITIILKDDGYNPARALTNLQEMKDKVFIICGLLGTAICNAAKDFPAENNIPLITAYGDIRIFARQPKDKIRNVFVTYPDYEDEAQYLTAWAVKNREAQKVAVFYQNDDYGKMGLEGVKKGLAATGLKAKLVGAVPYEITERALSTHGLKLKGSGADTLVLYADPTHAAIITMEIAKIGYHPTVLASFPLADPIMYKIAGPTWEGTYVGLPGNTGLPGTDPDADRVADILKKYDPKIEGKEFLALFGATSMMHFVEGLKNAGPNLTPESLIAGMEKIQEWKAENLGARVTYAPDRHHGNNASRVAQAKGGKIIGLEPWTVFQPRF
jgi:ABC-type branched-subunit amino acid transport system substrate-binding protein